MLCNKKIFSDIRVNIIFLFVSFVISVFTSFFIFCCAKIIFNFLTNKFQLNEIQNSSTTKTKMNGCVIIVIRAISFLMLIICVCWLFVFVDYSYLLINNSANYSCTFYVILTHLLIDSSEISSPLVTMGIIDNVWSILQLCNDML